MPALPDLSELTQQVLARIDMTQQEIADAIGVTQPFVNRIKTGKKLPSLQTLAKLAELAGGELVVEFREPKRKKK
ncbi:MAG: helix-turn-helix transcriptional regulator [Candidatus Paceibacterota bacterium]